MLIGPRTIRAGNARVAMLSLMLSGQTHGQCRYEVTVLPEINCGAFGGPPAAVAVNNLGHVAAYGYCSHSIAVLWTGGGTLTYLPPAPGYAGARAWDLNDLDEVCGAVYGSNGRNEQACLWRNGQPILLGIPAGGNYSIATGINNKSEICGYWGHNNVAGLIRAFIWRDGIMKNLELPLGPASAANDISDASYITGWMGMGGTGNAHAFLWSKEATLDLGAIPGGVSAQGVGLGSFNRVAGWGYLESTIPFGRRAIIWNGVTPTVLPPLKNLEFCLATDTNGFATVGYCFNYPTPEDGAFLYQDQTLFDLSDLTLEGSVSTAYAVNQHGTIIADGHVNGGTATFLLTPVGAVPADVTQNCRVNVDDLLAVITEWGQGNSFADIDKNGTVNVQDLLLVIEQWSF